MLKHNRFSYPSKTSVAGHREADGAASEVVIRAARSNTVANLSKVCILFARPEFLLPSDFP